MTSSRAEKLELAKALVERERRATLIAKKNVNQIGTLEWNVILQGPDETVFFDIGL